MNNPFKITEGLPETEEVYKAWLIGFMQAAFAGLIIVMPLLVMLGQVKQVTDLSISWYALMGGSICWCLFILVTQRYWFRLTFNMALILYKFDRVDKAKRAKKFQTSNTEEKKAEP